MSDFFCTKTAKARKEHKCCLCDKIIHKGEVHFVKSGKFEGYMFSDRQCLPCEPVLEEFHKDWDGGYSQHNVKEWWVDAKCAKCVYYDDYDEGCLMTHYCRCENFKEMVQ